MQKHLTLRLLVYVAVFVQILALFPIAQDPTQIKDLIAAALALALAGALAFSVRKRGIPFRFPGVSGGILAAFLAIGAISALFSQHPLNSLVSLARWDASVVLFVAAANVFVRAGQVWRLMAVVCVATALASLYGFCQHFGFDPFPWSTRDVEQYRQLPATFGNPNLAGHTLVLAIVMAGALSFRRSTRWCVLPGIAMLVHLRMTHMRAAFLALGAALLLVLTIAWVRRRPSTPSRAVAKTVRLYAAVAALGATGAVALCYFKTGLPCPVDASLMLRYEGYYGAARMACDHPVLGVGPGNYRIENPCYWTPFEQRWFATQHKMNYHVHNDFLEAAAEMGLPGFMLYAGFLLWSLLSSLHAGFAAPDRERRLLGFAGAALFVAFAVDGLLGFNSHVPVSRTLIFLMAGALQGVAWNGVAWASGGVCAATEDLSADARFVSKPTSVFKPAPAHPWHSVVFLLTILAACAVLAETSSFLGEFYYKRGLGAKYWNAAEAACRFFETGARFEPWNERSPVELGGLAMARQQPVEAAVHFRRALETNPYYPDTWMWLGRAYINEYALGTASDTPPSEEAVNLAETAANRALGLCPPCADAEEVLARVWRIRAEMADADAKACRQKAIEHAESALRLGVADLAGVHLFVAEVYLAMDQPEPAERAFAAAVAAAPENAGIWSAYDAFAETNNRVPAFLAAVEENIDRVAASESASRDKTSAMLWLWASRARDILGDATGARAAALDAVRLAPERLEAWGTYAARLEAPVRFDALRREIDDACARVKPVAPAIRALYDAWRTQTPDAVPSAARAIAECARDRAQHTAAEAVQAEYGWLAGLLATMLQTEPLSETARARTAYALGLLYVVLQAWEPAAQTLDFAAPNLESAERAEAVSCRDEALRRLGRVPGSPENAEPPATNQGDSP